MLPVRTSKAPIPLLKLFDSVLLSLRQVVLAQAFKSRTPVHQRSTGGRPQHARAPETLRMRSRLARVISK